MTEAASVTTFVVGDRLPWPDESAPSDISGPFDAAAIYDSGTRRACSIRKVSKLGVTLRADLARSPGDQVAVELGTGQRQLGTIAWASGGELGIAFAEPVDVLALINRQLVSQPGERRAMPRVEVRCAMHLKSGGTMLPVTLRNISARGLQVEGSTLPDQGAYVELFVDGLNMPAAEVVWRAGPLAGLELFEELSWTSIIPWIRSIVRAPVQ